jgi:uncharacterized protein with HEPN domain
MPRRDIRMYLEDIVVSCDHVLSHVQGVNEQQFMTSRFVQAAVERELSIIAEAVCQSLKMEATLEGRITQARRIAHFRNILIHAYDIVDKAKIWASVRDDVPLLRREAAALLAERESGGNEGNAPSSPLDPHA